MTMTRVCAGGWHNYGDTMEETLATWGTTRYGRALGALDRGRVVVEGDRLVVATISRSSPIAPEDDLLVLGRLEEFWSSRAMAIAPIDRRRFGEPGPGSGGGLAPLAVPTRRRSDGGSPRRRELLGRRQGQGRERLVHRRSRLRAAGDGRRRRIRRRPDPARARSLALPDDPDQVRLRRHPGHAVGGHGRGDRQEPSIVAGDLERST